MSFPRRRESRDSSRLTSGLAGRSAHPGEETSTSLQRGGPTCQRDDHAPPVMLPPSTPEPPMTATPRIAFLASHADGAQRALETLTAMHGQHAPEDADILV